MQWEEAKITYYLTALTTDQTDLGNTAAAAELSGMSLYLREQMSPCFKGFSDEWGEGKHRIYCTSLHHPEDKVMLNHTVRTKVSRLSNKDWGKAEEYAAPVEVFTTSLNSEVWVVLVPGYVWREKSLHKSSVTFWKEYLQIRRQPRKEHQTWENETKLLIYNLQSASLRLTYFCKLAWLSASVRQHPLLLQESQILGWNRKCLLKSQRKKK